MESNPLVTTEWLADHLTEDDVKLIDFRWYLGDDEGGRRAYAQGHIPGAAFLDLDEVTGESGAGRHPLPSREQVQKAMRKVGVNNDDFVVVYDDAGGSVAARLWWLLRVHGHEKVAVLDGGIQTWVGQLEQAEPSIQEGNFNAEQPDYSSVVQFEDVRRLDDSVLLDARAPERFEGKEEPIDPKAGHIPKARNAFWKQNLGPDGKFLSPEDLRRRYAGFGVEKGNAVVYCGSGVTSCHDLLAIELAGLGPVRLYAGSWSDWSSRSDAPVATGSD